MSGGKKKGDSGGLGGNKVGRSRPIQVPKDNVRKDRGGLSEDGTSSTGPRLRESTKQDSPKKK